MTPALIEKLLWCALSALLTGGGVYWTVIRKLSFIEGQLTMLMHHFGMIQVVKEKHAVLDKAVEKQKYDLNLLFERLKKLEDGRPNGSGHG